LNQVDRLYEVQKDKYELLEEIKKKEAQKREEAELRECTFAPRTNGTERVEDLKSLKSSENIPKDFYKSVGRLRYAAEKKSELKSKKEHIPIGENYQRRRNERFNPPSCANVDKKIRMAKPFMYIDVNIGGGK
jgi:hypothetical protein